MEFPSRSGGAQGGLIKGNLFAQSGAPAFSNTKHGDSVIHLVNGRISITREKPETPPPYLLLPYYKDGIPRLLRTAAEAEVPEYDVPIAQLPTQAITGRGVYVGDGYFLCMERDPGAKVSRPVLVNIYEPEEPFVNSTLPSGGPSPENVMGANVQLNAPWLMDYANPEGAGSVFPTHMACGWRDSERRYGFAVFGILQEGPSSWMASRYVCIVGDTGTRTMSTHALPTLPDSTIPMPGAGPANEYKTSWWGNESIYGMPETLQGDFPGSARCYCVGPGHLLALLVGQERLGSREYDGGPGGAAVHGFISPKWLPVGSAPYLLRSRDFGETWAMERADFLVSGEAPTTLHFMASYENIDPPQPRPLQRVGDYGYFIAAPIGDGRVVIAALGKNENMPTYDALRTDGHSVTVLSDRSWRFYVSDTSGTGFTRKAWPLDGMQAAEPWIDIHSMFAMPRQRTYEHPTFSAMVRPSRAYSFGPGHFIITTIRYGVDLGNEAKYDWGEYPQDYPITVWSTYDGGNTWRADRLPQAATPHADDLGTYYSMYPKPQFQAKSDAWAAAFLAFGCIDPAAEDQKPVLTCLHWRFVESAEVFVSSDPDDNVGSLEIVASLSPTGNAVVLSDYSVPSTWQRSNTAEVFYTGNLLSAQRPELVYPGYQEFEEP